MEAMRQYAGGTIRDVPCKKLDKIDTFYFRLECLPLDNPKGGIIVNLLRNLGATQILSTWKRR